MRVLVLGGTVFVGHTVAAEALRRGHDVLCAARGTSGAVPEGATLIPVDRDDPDGLAPLAGEHFDAVVDVATISYPWVSRALDALAAGAGHWTFISSISAYADPATPGQDASGPLLPPLYEHSSWDDPAFRENPDLYGSIKVAGENAVSERIGDRAFLLRAGLIVGAGDPHDRFGYWPARLAQPQRNGGRVVMPDAPGQLTQYIDVQDLAAWVLDAAEGGLTGAFDGVGPAWPLEDLLKEIAELVDPGLKPVWVPEQVLIEEKVQPWSGRRSLPLWLPESHRGICAKDVSASLTAGLPVSSLEETVTGVLDWERRLGLDRERKAGLSAEEEAEVLAAVN
jgi:nucleoside-diphosphate-sugar epimerase